MKFWTAIPLFLSNLIPLYGVLELGWSVPLLMFLYWSETAIIGFFTILKILHVDYKEGHFLINPNVPTEKVRAKTKLGVIAFFIFHYGAFMGLHFVFLLIFFVFNGPFITGDFFDLWYQFKINFLAFFIAHLISYFANYLGKKEYLHATVTFLVWAAYKRVIFMHFIVIGCGLLSFYLLTNTPLVFMSFIVGFKTVIDLYFHFEIHRALQKG